MGDDKSNILRGPFCRRVVQLIGWCVGAFSSISHSNRLFVQTWSTSYWRLQYEMCKWHSESSFSYDCLRWCLIYRLRQPRCCCCCFMNRKSKAPPLLLFVFMFTDIEQSKLEMDFPLFSFWKINFEAHGSPILYFTFCAHIINFPLIIFCCNFFFNRNRCHELHAENVNSFQLSSLKVN